MEVAQPVGSPPPELAGASDAGEVVAAELAEVSDRDAVVFFMLESVKDSQATIRAIDTKVSILLAALSIPLDRIATTLLGWHAHGFALSLGNVIVALGVALYALAIFVAIRTLSGIGNAAPHVVGARSHNVFYAGGLFGFTWADAFAGRRNVQSRFSLGEYVKRMPGTYAAVVLELTSEIMSLAYIRDLKLHRQRTAYALTISAAIVALIGILA
ncbi:MAG: hypothetical protein ACREM6_14415 [Vulcanimicrobiaceae bacterium]